MRPFRLLRVLGVDVMGDFSLMALGVLLSWVLYLELRLPASGVAPAGALAGALAGGVLFLATVLAHEVSHVAVAQRRGLTVKRIRLFIFGGASEIDEAEMSSGTELAVAIAGPVTSAAIGAGLLGLAALVDGDGAVDGVLRFVGATNLALAGFNLLPGLPLDGGRVVRALLWRRTNDRDHATRIALRAGRIAGLVLIGGGLYLVVSGAVIGIWVALVGWLLTRMAATSSRNHRFEMATRGRKIGELMRPITESVPGSLTVAEAIDLYQVGPRLRTLVVSVDDRIVGILGQFEVDRIDPASRKDTLVAAVMTRIGPADVVDVSATLTEALQREPGATRHIVATSGGRVVGLIGHAEIAELLRFEEE